MSTTWKWIIALGVAWAAWHFGSAWFHPANHFRERDPSVKMTRVESYSLEATVLAVKWYGMGKEAIVSPLDLALAWGPLNDPEILEGLEVDHTYRYYHWYASEPVLQKWGGKRAIINNTANVHIIPENMVVQDWLKDVEPGDQLKLTGYLVDVRAPELGTWKTSRSRTDHGPGACEIFLVMNVEQR